LQALAKRLQADTGIFGDEGANHVLLNAYLPGQGILPHEVRKINPLHSVACNLCTLASCGSPVCGALLQRWRHWRDAVAVAIRRTSALPGPSCAHQLELEVERSPCALVRALLEGFGTGAGHAVEASPACRCMLDVVAHLAHRGEHRPVIWDQMGV